MNEIDSHSQGSSATVKLVNYTGPQNLEKQYNPGGTEIINLLINYTLLFLICNQHSVFFPHFSHLKKSGISGSKAGGVRARVERGGTAPRGLRGAGEKLPWHRGDPGKSRAMLSGGASPCSGSSPRIQPPTCEGRAGAAGLPQMFCAGLSPGLAAPLFALNHFECGGCQTRQLTWGRGKVLPSIICHNMNLSREVK